MRQLLLVIYVSIIICSGFSSLIPYSRLGELVIVLMVFGREFCVV